MLCMCEEFTLIYAKTCSSINMQSCCSRPNVTIMLSPRCSEPVSGQGPGYLLSSPLSPATCPLLLCHRAGARAGYLSLYLPWCQMSSSHHGQMVGASVTWALSDISEKRRASICQISCPRHSNYRYGCNCSSTKDLMLAVTVWDKQCNKQIHTEYQDSLRCWHGQFAWTLGVISAGMSESVAAELFRAAFYPSYSISLWPVIGVLPPGGGQADPAWGHCHHRCGQLQKRAARDIRNKK